MIEKRTADQFSIEPPGSPVIARVTGFDVYNKASSFEESVALGAAPTV